MAAVFENALVAVNESDRRFTGAGVHVAAIKCDVAAFIAQLGDVERLFSFRTLVDGKLISFSVDFEYSLPARISLATLFVSSLDIVCPPALKVRSTM